MINVFNGPVDPMTLEEFAEERKSSDGDTPVFDSNVRRRAQVSYTDDGRKMLDGKLKENETPGTDALWSATITRGVAKEWKERAHGNGIRRAVRYVSHLAYEIQVAVKTTSREYGTLILVLLNLVLMVLFLQTYKLPPFQTN